MLCLINDIPFILCVCPKLELNKITPIVQHIQPRLIYEPERSEAHRR